MATLTMGKDGSGRFAVTQLNARGKKLPAEGRLIVIPHKLFLTL